MHTKSPPGHDIGEYLDFTLDSKFMNQEYNLELLDEEEHEQVIANEVQENFYAQIARQREDRLT